MNDTWTREAVLERVARDFEDSQHAMVLAALDEYPGDSAAGRARVQLAVLALANGSLELVRQNVAHARADYRDVLYSAEHDARSEPEPALSSRRDPALRLLALVFGAVLLTLLSSVVERHRMEVQDWDCPPAPASCARPVLVAGFPVPYLSDYHGISVVNRVSLVGGLLGEDHIHWRAFLLDTIVYALVLAGAWAVAHQVRARAT
jgi:hypothetical protein